MSGRNLLPKAKGRPRATERACHLQVGGEALCVYPLDDLLQELGRRWALLVVAAIGGGQRRFHEIQRELAGISSRTLTERLKALEALGLVERTAFPGVPLHVEYRLTAKGAGLLDALAPLLRWASREA